jgi:chitin synthase
MMNPDVEAERQGQERTTINPFRGTLTTGRQKSKSENERHGSYGTSTLSLRVARFIAGSVLFLEVLGCLVLSKLSFVALAQEFNDTVPLPLEESKVDKAAKFWRLLIPLMIPSLFSLLRCIWRGLISRTRRNYPWPYRKAIIAGVLTSVGESVALAVFAYIIAARIPNSSLTIILMCGVFGGTIVDRLRRRHFSRHERPTPSRVRAADDDKPPQRSDDRYQHDGSGARDASKTHNESAEKPSRWKLIRNILPKNKRCRTIATWIALFLQIGSIVGLLLVLIILETEFDDHYWGVLIAIPIALALLSIVWCSPVQEYLNTPETITADDRPPASARWKNGILTGLWRLLSLPAVAIVMALIPELQLGVDVSYLAQGLRQLLDDISNDTFFLVNIFSSWGAYVGAWLACTIMMDKAGFVMPLLFATPVAVIAVVVICALDVTSALACGSDPNDPFDAYGIIPICLGFLWISQIICCLFYVCRTKLIPLIKEENLFIQPYYNSPFTEQSLMLNRRTEFDDGMQFEPLDVALSSNVFICTTMFHEEEHEQKRLLESIYGIACEQAKYKTRNFESHIFFDGGAAGLHTTKFANLLFSLLHETLKVELKEAQKWETPYGLQLQWNLAGDMPFCVHLKDPNKIKKLKRWSQVMYMSYVLDYRCRKSSREDDNNYILTTDGDAVFSREAVEILLDLLSRDQQVGAACGRVRPLGSGPVVWYQIFDYAIGHWFQKVSEHVLGSVMCCPGCFSLFRVRALREVLPTYATKASKAKEFLTKDMGEDRWLCTLMVQAGWRLEYSAAAVSDTHCPDNFDEFYKQRRRWIPSTLANLAELCTSSGQVTANNDDVFTLFIVYQAMMIFSSVIAPGTVILVMAAGTTYAMYTTQNYDSNGTYVTFLVIYILTAVGYAAVCLWCSPKVQLKTAKVLTFVFAIIMAVVSVGVAVQISRGTGGDESIPVTSSPNTTLPAKPSQSVSLGDIAVSTWYLAGLASVFIMAALLHPSELYCLFHALWYLLFLPSGYLFLIIYSICNLHSRSWGTREEAKQNTTNQNVWQALKSFFDVRDICSCCTCCFRSEPESPQSQADSTSSKDIEETNKPTPHTTDQSDSRGIQHSTLSPCDGPCAMSVEGGLGGNAPLPSGRCVRNSLPIKDFLDNVGLTDDSYVQKFRKSGYDDTSFFIKMKRNDIEALGVKSTGSVNRIMKAIDKLPDMCMTIQPGVPENVAVWLESLGLSEYRDSFAKAGYEGKDGVSSLVSVDSAVLRQEIGVSKPGEYTAT